MPIPAAIFARTMAIAVQLPIIKGPIMSVNGSVVISRGSFALYTRRDIKPKRPQENRKPKPIPEVSFVNLITYLNTSN